MIKNYLSGLLGFTIIFFITFAFSGSINMSIVMAIGLLVMGLGRTLTNLTEKEIFKILSFLSIISIIVIIIVNICNQKELFRTVFMCIAIPALAFSAYYIGKRFMRDKRKTGKNVE
jgi:CDP-diglyceride synthetase